MAQTYTATELNSMTRNLIRRLGHQLGIHRAWKLGKSTLVRTILSHQADAPRATTHTASAYAPVSGATAAAAPAVSPLAAVEACITSVVTRPNAEAGNRTTTNIRVSCGANSQAFPVAGRTVGAVSELLREVLNVDRMAQGIVNGTPVEDSYVLRSGDTLEFLKPAGRKG